MAAMNSLSQNPEVELNITEKEKDVENEKDEDKDEDKETDPFADDIVIDVPLKKAGGSLLLKKKPKARQGDIKSVYSRTLITRNVTIPIMNIGRMLRETIEKILSLTIDSKCILEGFVKTDSIKIITYSSGIIQGSNVMFEVVFECEVCFPVEGMLVNCVAKNITKAGIRAESSSEIPSPFIVFIARDHHYMVPYFSTIEEGGKFTARVIGQRFELNDKYVSIIAELIEPKVRDFKKKEPSKPRLVF